MHRIARAVACVAASAALGLASVAAVASPGPSDQGSSDHPVLLGDFAGPVWHPLGDDGVRHIDVEATLDALEEANINTYAYVLFGLPHYGDGETPPDEITAVQWQNFPGFAAAAAERDIDVFLYIAPPSIGYLDDTPPRPEQEPGLEPYGWDYVAWAEAVAELSVEHENIKGLMIDDFDDNTVQANSPYSFAFSRAYVQEMSETARAISPDFEIHGVVYYQGFDVASTYRGALDGFIFPYMAATGVRGTTDPSMARSEGEVIGDLTHCISEGWCAQFLATDTEEGEEASLSATGEVTQGAQHELTFALNRDAYWPNCDDSLGCLEFSVPAHQETDTGEYAGVVQSVAIDDRGQYELSFWVDDGFNRDVQSGHHQLHAIVDGEVVHVHDVAGVLDGGHVTVDVTDEVAEKSEVDLEFRLVQVESVDNFEIEVWLDSVDLAGAQVLDPSFEDRDSGAWEFVREGENVAADYNGGHYTLEAVVNGEVAYSEALYGYEGWTERSIDVTDLVDDESGVDVDIRLRALDDVPTSLAVWVDDVAVSGTALSADTFDDGQTWSYSPSPHILAEPVPDAETIWMTYAARHSADPPGHQPTANYIEEVQGVGLELIREGRMDGSLLYVLNKSDPVTSPEGEERERIAQLYGDFSATEIGRCDTIHEGEHSSVHAETGRTCLVGAEVTGGIRAEPGAEVVVLDSHVRGLVRTDGAEVTICGSSLSGGAQIAQSPDVRIGASGSLCDRNEISGTVSISGTSGELVIAGLDLRGSLACTANSAEAETRAQHNDIRGSSTGQCAEV